MIKKVTDDQAKQAVRDLISWLGDDPNREELKNTPQRYLSALKEILESYDKYPNQQDIKALLKVFNLTEKYKNFVLIKNITFISMCEHHIMPIEGIAHVAYTPSSNKVVGLSKINRLVNAVAKRLQNQEAITVQIADIIEQELKSKSIAVIVDAKHHCISLRGSQQYNSSTQTVEFRGQIAQDNQMQANFMQMIQQKI